MNNQRKNFLLGIGEIVFASVLLVIAAGVSLTAFMRLFDPVHWGLWVSPRMFLFGVVEDPNVAHEVLGDKIYPVAALVIFLGFMAAKEAWAFAQLHFRNARST